MTPTNLLLTTKLYAPPLRAGQVDRPRLMQKLNQGLLLGHSLTLVSAPAGYGKTTLVVNWLYSLTRPFAWLSVERSDNHPLMFFKYFVASLQQIDAGIGQRFQTLLDGSSPEEISIDQLEIWLPTLLNEINQISSPFVLVLDDYHTITNLAIHEALVYILDHQPPQMHLIMITRQDPLLQLSRLRSKGQVTEIRMTDLRFTKDEAVTFLNESMCLNLASEEIASLQTRTEGWIAGLQLAAISLTEIPNPDQSQFDLPRRAEFIRSFAGDDHFIMDYLLDEVLNRLPESVQRFLLFTSVLKRFCSSLCDAIVISHPASTGMISLNLPEVAPDQDAQQSRISPSQATLEYLEKSNIFLIPLDNRRCWYRYHHLFAELLNARLQAIYPNLLTELHRRASDWYEQNGFIAEAIDHALLAEDFDRALSLIEHEAYTSIWGSGDLPALLNWSNRLPEEVIRTRPRLCLYCARGLFFAGQIQAAEAYLKFAENALETRSAEDPTTSELYGVLYTNQATFAAMQGESQKALLLAQQAIPLLPKDDPSTEARVQHAIGMAEYLSGHIPTAIRAFTQAATLAKMANNRNLGMDVVACQALALLIGGNAQRARQICEQVLAEANNERLYPAMSAVYIAYGEILYAQNELPAALESLETGLELGRKAGWAHVLWRGLAMISAVKRCLGDIPGTYEALRQFEQVARKYNNPVVKQLVEPWKMRINLSLGDLETPTLWIESSPIPPQAMFFREFYDLTVVRIFLVQGQTDRALPILNHALAAADEEGRGQSVIEGLILRAIGLLEQGKPDPAQEDLTRALILAEPEGYARLFVDRLSPISDLLRKIHRDKISPSLRNFVDKLLSTIDHDPHQPIVFQPNPSAHSEVVEPLSERELEVLQLMAKGLSNPEIAAKLFLSVNTLRAHSAHILQKLDVHSRGQAVARARELGFLT